MVPHLEDLKPVGSYHFEEIEQKAPRKREFRREIWFKR